MRVAILGAAGKMGRMLGQAAVEGGCSVVAAIEQPSSPALGQDFGTVAGLSHLGVAIASDLGAAKGADAAIDFSAPNATAQSVAKLAELGCAVVIGTTGLAEAHKRAIAEAARTIAIVQSANMSLGVNVLLGLLEKAAAALGPEYDVEIVELHHRLKKDAPSGTALMMGEQLAKTLGRDLDKVRKTGRDGQVGARSREEIGVLAVRGGDIVGEHTAYFCGIGERLELTHRASSRETFARGAIRAAKWLKGRPSGLYSMRDVLGL
jgi:4-hydroxy-tetrahydrodipicolinate reductase